MPTIQVYTNAALETIRSASAAVQGAAAAATAVVGVPVQAQIGNWVLTHAPSVAGQATVTRAAQANVRHVCTGIYATFINDSASAITMTLYLRDGASGAGPALWQLSMKVPTLSSGNYPIIIPGLSIVGTAGNAMTLEFPAGLANIAQTVNLTGYSC